MDDRVNLVRSRKLLYQDDVGGDACGIGGVAAKDGKPNAEVVKKALGALIALEHRGGVCGEAGDGAGITMQLPQPFFKEEAKRLNFDQARYLKPEDRLAVGSLFLFDREPGKLDAARKLIRDTLANGPVRILGFRKVPVNPDVLPATARDTAPGAIEQIILKVEGDDATVESWLYRQRLKLRESFLAAGIKAYIPSLSSKLVSYKGLCTSQHFVDSFRTCTPRRSRRGSPSSIAATARTRFRTGSSRSRFALAATTARSTRFAPIATRCMPFRAA